MLRWLVALAAIALVYCLGWVVTIVVADALDATIPLLLVIALVLTPGFILFLLLIQRVAHPSGLRRP